MPDIGRFIVVQIDRHGEPIPVHPHPLWIGQKFPSPMDGLTLKIIAKAKIPQHFEEGMVVRRSSHIVDIARPQTFLACGRPREFKFYFPQEMRLELVHASRSKQDGGIPGGHNHVTSSASVPLRFKKS